MNKQITTKDLHLCKICSATIINRQLSPSVLNGYCQFTCEIDNCYYILAYRTSSLFKGCEYRDAITDEKFFDKESIITSIQTKNLPIVVESTPIDTNKKYLTIKEVVEYIRKYNNGYVSPKYNPNPPLSSKKYKLVKLY